MSLNVFETIREEVDLVGLARRFTTLKRAGKKMKGCCPVHQESTPSFFIYEDGHAFCYGCQWSGDVVALWAHLKGLTQIEAALDLAREYGIKLPDKDPDAQRKADERRQKESNYEQQAIAYHQALSRHPAIRDWWNQRGFNDEMIKQYLLGATQDGTAATIPYWYRGRIQAFIKRQLQGEPKYLLSSTEEFATGHKPLFIPSSTAGDVCVVEGFIDGLSLDALGFKAVAIGSTGISEHQKEELLRLKGDLYIYADADGPGAESSRRWVRELYPKARLCEAEYGAGRKDINDLFKDECEHAKAILEKLKPSAADALDIALSEAPKGVMARKSWKYAKEHVLPLIPNLVDEGERSAALTDAAKSLGLKASDL